jgi:hypothetical protein
MVPLPVGGTPGLAGVPDGAPRALLAPPTAAGVSAGFAPGAEPCAFPLGKMTDESVIIGGGHPVAWLTLPCPAT